jgi:hypothetical protein
LIFIPVANTNTNTNTQFGMMIKSEEVFKIIVDMLWKFKIKYNLINFHPDTKTYQAITNYINKHFKKGQNIPVSIINEQFIINMLPNIHPEIQFNINTVQTQLQHTVQTQLDFHTNHI